MTLACSHAYTKEGQDTEEAEGDQVGLHATAVLVWAAEQRFVRAPEAIGGGTPESRPLRRRFAQTAPSQGVGGGGGGHRPAAPRVNTPLVQKRLDSILDLPVSWPHVSCSHALRGTTHHEPAENHGCHLVE